MSGPRCRICDGVGQGCYQSGEHRMYRCSTCRTAFVHPTPSDEQLAHFYDTYHLAGEQGWYDDIEARMQADFPMKVALVRASARPGGAGRLLDVGCGKGYFVKACVDAGIQAQGVDLSRTGVEFAREKLGVQATAGLLADLKETLGQFDTATFWATIEHLPDPVATLRDIRDVLKPGGCLLLDTGIGDDWLDRLLPGRVQWYDPPQHLFVFSARGMQMALEAAGFRMRSLDPCFDRSTARRAMRRARNGAAALGLRTVAACTGMREGPFGATRFPIGNLMSAVAERVG